MAQGDIIKHIYEPNPLACGQAVLSMLTAVPVQQIIEITKTDAELTLKQMKSVLCMYGFTYSNERKSAENKSDLPNIALLSLETPKCWHWSLYFYGTFYDPEHGVLNDFPECNRKYYWEIRKAENI